MIDLIESNGIVKAVEQYEIINKHETKSVFELARMRDDKIKYMQSAKLLISYLEKLLLDDVNNKYENKDTGWGTHSLVNEYGRGENK